MSFRLYPRLNPRALAIAARGGGCRSLYFAEGVPYVVVMTVAVIMFKRLGVGNTQDRAVYELALPAVCDQAAVEPAGSADRHAAQLGGRHAIDGGGRTGVRGAFHSDGELFCAGAWYLWRWWRSVRPRMTLPPTVFICSR